MFIYFVLCCLAVITYYVSSRREYYKLVKIIPGPSGYPLIGNALDFLRNMDRTFITLSNYIGTYGDRILIFFGPNPVVLVNNVEDLEKVFMSTDLIVKSKEYDLVREWLGDGLITSKGNLWSQRRKLITPCFHFTIIDKFIGPINRHAKILVEVLKKEFSGENSTYQDVNKFIQRCTLDIICETSMGHQMNSQDVNDPAANSYLQAIHRLGELFQYRSIRPWLHNDYVWNLTSYGKEDKACREASSRITKTVLAERKRRLAEGSNKNTSQDEDDDLHLGKRVKRPLLDLLLEAQADNSLSITDSGLHEEITTFIFAGHDTVSMAISFCLYCLGNHPEILAKVESELDSIFGGDVERPVTSVDLKGLHYLELCIKETLRMFPSVPHYGREVTKPFRLDENTVLPVGTAVHAFPIKLHRNPKYWPNPDKFIPERFDPENPEYGKTTKSPFCYIPFSAGPRNCIGQKSAMNEAKIVLATILRNFSLKSETGILELELLTEMILRARGGLKMKFCPK